MAELSDEVRTFIVTALACFRRPSLIVRDVRDKFGVELSRHAVQYYHPEKNGGKRLGEKWRKLFEATRRAFVDKAAEIGIAHQSYRLLLYQRAADYYEERGNYILAAEMIEKAAKEVRGAYTTYKQRGAADGDSLTLDNIAETIISIYNGGGSST